MADPAAVIFDLDGTLIDSAPDIHATALKVLAAEGLPPLEFEVVKGFIGAGVGMLLTRILRALNLPGNGPQHERMLATFVGIYEEAHDLTVLYPGVAEMLDRLSNLGHPMALCTNKPEAPTAAILRHFGLAGYFPVVVGGDTLTVRKPDPAPLRLVIDRLGSRRAVFVGDSEVDAETTAAAGVPLALFSGGYRKTAAEQLGAKVIFDHHRALPDLLAKALR